ncbi:hypothetical protein D3C81_2074570 [compost metagenome]
MKRDKPRLIFGKLHPQPAGDNRPCFLPQLKLLRVQTFDLPQQHVFDRQAFLLPLDGKMAVVGQRDVETVLQFPQPLRRQPNNAVAGGHHLKGDLTK